MTKNLYYENGYALLIGIKYAHWNGIGLLNGTLNDIRDLKDHFLHLQKAAYLPENLETLCEAEATAANILQALDNLAEKTKNDPQASVLVYYSGHGETNGTHNFLVPYDFDLAKWRKDRTFDAEKVVLSKQFTQKLDAITAQKCLVILDCCHAESMPTDRGLSSSVLFLNALLTEETQGVAHNLALGSGRIILTSCEAHEKSLDLDTNGLFTKTLLECLNGSENIEKDGWVRLIDMMRYVPKTVKNTAFAQYNHAQNPMFKRIENLNSEDFIVCAYNIAQAKGLSGSQAPLQAPTQPIRNVLNFKTELYALLEAEQQNAITDIIIKINESPYTYDKVQMTTLKGANPMQLALMPAQYVSSTKLLINSLK